MFEPKPITAGRYFKPYSIYKDGQSLAFHYTRFKYKGKNHPRFAEYPVSLVLSQDGLAVYWQGSTVRDGNDAKSDYSVEKLLDIKINESHKAIFKQWLSQTNLLPRAMPDYIIQKDGPEANKSFYTLFYEEHPDPPHVGKQEILTRQQFFLDLLFDLRYSNVFNSHPLYLALLDYIQSIPLSCAIYYKSEFLWAKNELEQVAKKAGSPGKEEQFKFNDERLGARAKRWIAFLRTPEGEAGTEDETWFVNGVEGEHDAAFSISKKTDGTSKESPHSIALSIVKKEAEDSMQWLLQRYDLKKAYRFQFYKVFGKASRWVFRVSLFALFILLGFFICRGLKCSPNHALFTILMFCTIFVIAGIIALFVIERFVFHLIIRWLWNRCFKNKWDNEHKWNDTIASFPKILPIIKPKILLASGAVWTFIFTSGIDLVWDPSFRITWWLIGLCLLIFFVTVIFTMGKLNGIVTYRKHKMCKMTKRGFFVISVAFVYSFAIGLVGMSVNAEKQIYAEGQSKWLMSMLADSSSQNKIVQIKDQEGLFISEEARTQAKMATGLSESLSIMLPAICHDNQLNDRVYFIVNGEKICSWLSSIRIVALIDPLIFFTIVSVCLGLLLEMSFKVEDSGISFD